MTKTYFVTGTDTDVGKTVICQGIIGALKKKGQKVVGYKPVSAGCKQTLQGLRNEDAVALQEASNIKLEYSEVNPIAFVEPVAPHLLAMKLSSPISMQEINLGLEHLHKKEPDIVLIEGAGGWRLPLGQGQFLSDFVVSKKIPVILTVGIKLGCLNHALLTAETIINDGLEFAGWVANIVEPNSLYIEENIDTLKDMLPCRYLGTMKHLDNFEKAYRYIDVSGLI